MKVTVKQRILQRLASGASVLVLHLGALSPVPASASTNNPKEPIGVRVERFRTTAADSLKDSVRPAPTDLKAKIAQWGNGWANLWNNWNNWQKWNNWNNWGNFGNWGNW